MSDNATRAPCTVPPLVGPFCQTCGSKTVMIRGRYPRDPEREVCPTCLAERMDTIREVADRDYGRAYQVRPNDKAHPRAVASRGEAGCSTRDTQ